MISPDPNVCIVFFEPLACLVPVQLAKVCFGLLNASITQTLLSLPFSRRRARPRHMLRAWSKFVRGRWRYLMSKIRTLMMRRSHFLASWLQYPCLLHIKMGLINRKIMHVGFACHFVLSPFFLHFAFLAILLASALAICSFCLCRFCFAKKRSLPCL